jgi:hypothetical protein
MGTGADCRRDRSLVQACPTCPCSRVDIPARGTAQRLGLLYLIGPYAEQLQSVLAEGGADGHIGGIATSRQENAADAPLIVPGVESVPGAPQIGFEPAGEIHGGIRRRHANVCEISRAVARGYVQTAAQRNGEMREIAANPFLLRIGVPRRFAGAGEVIAELHVLVREIADGLYTPPTGFHLAEHSPGVVHQFLGFAVTASQQIHQGVLGQSAHGVFLGHRKCGVRKAGVRNDGVGAQGDTACRGFDPRAGITEVCRDKSGLEYSDPIACCPVGSSRECGWDAHAA